ncbi:MAG: VCBS domain-containing protein [Elainellaceae cyanobacterium]
MCYLKRRLCSLIAVLLIWTAWGSPSYAQTADAQSPIVIEAESMDLQNYVLEYFPFASLESATNGNVISLIDKSADPEKILDRGTATTVFEQQPGLYDIQVTYYDENDGVGQIQFLKNDVEIGTVLLNDSPRGNSPTAANRKSAVIASNVTLAQGDRLTLAGLSDPNPTPQNPIIGEFTRIDSMELILDSAPPLVPDLSAQAVEDGPEVLIAVPGEPGMTYTLMSQPTNEAGQPEGSLQPQEITVPAVRPDAITLEAETLALEGYGMDGRFPVEGISLIFRENGEIVRVDEGVAEGPFSGPSGTYDVEMGYYDESDGQGSLEVLLGGRSVAQLTLDEDLAGGTPNPANFIERQVVAEIPLNEGDTCTIVGKRNAEEGARVDYIRFVSQPISPGPIQPFVFDPGDDFQDLGEGQSRVVTAAYRATNADGAVSDDGAIAVTTQGVNDEPVIGTDTGTLTECGDTNGDGLLKTGGTLTISDVDSGESGFSAASQAGTFGTFQIDEAGNWRYEADLNQPDILDLEKGQKLTETFSVTSLDGTQKSDAVSVDIDGVFRALTVVPLNPKATYLFTNQDPDAIDVSAIELPSEISPGDTIKLESVGSFFFFEGSDPTRRAFDEMVGVFSATDQLGPLKDASGRNNIARVVDAIDAGEDTQTGRTSQGLIKTDIPQDFAIVSTRIQVPAGARYLFVSPRDSFFGDNSVNGNWAIRISVRDCAS